MGVARSAGGPTRRKLVAGIKGLGGRGTFWPVICFEAALVFEVVRMVDQYTVVEVKIKHPAHQI